MKRDFFFPSTSGLNRNMKMDWSGGFLLGFFEHRTELDSNTDVALCYTSNRQQLDCFILLQLFCVS